VKALLAATWLAMLGALPGVADAAFVRANCRGVQEFSTSKALVSCAESSVLGGEGPQLLLGHTQAEASLARGSLMASAAGGQIRDVGSNGGEAGALFMDRLTISGDWDGAIPVTVRLCVQYAFAGFGESRIHAVLRTSSKGASTGGNQAGMRLSHRGFGGTVLGDLNSRGRFDIPLEGPRAAHSTVQLSVTEEVDRRVPELKLRVDVAAYALPNLELLEPVLSSFSRVEAFVLVSLPAPLVFSSESGLFLSESSAQQASDETWVMMSAPNNGRNDALRSHRRRHRAAARSDCRHQLGLDG
jgi:hypothetical protein